MKVPSYHDLVIQAAGMPKPVSIFNMSYGIRVTCSRTDGWRVWDVWGDKEELIGGEYDGKDKPLYLGLTDGTPIVGKKIQTHCLELRLLQRRM